MTTDTKKERKSQILFDQLKSTLTSSKSINDISPTTTTTATTIVLDDKERTFEIVKSQLPLIMEAVLEERIDYSNTWKRTCEESVFNVISLGIDTVCSLAKELVTNTNADDLECLLLKYLPHVRILSTHEELTCKNFVEGLKTCSGDWDCIRKFLRFNLHAVVTSTLVHELQCKPYAVACWRASVKNFLQESPPRVVIEMVERMLLTTTWNDFIVTLSDNLITLFPQNSLLFEPSNFDLSHEETVCRFLQFAELFISVLTGYRFYEPEYRGDGYSVASHTEKTEDLIKSAARLRVKCTLAIWKSTIMHRKAEKY